MFSFFFDISILIILIISIIINFRERKKNTENLKLTILKSTKRQKKNNKFIFDYLKTLEHSLNVLNKKNSTKIDLIEKIDDLHCKLEKLTNDFRLKLYLSGKKKEFYKMYDLIKATGFKRLNLQTFFSDLEHSRLLLKKQAEILGSDFNEYTTPKRAEELQVLFNKLCELKKVSKSLKTNDIEEKADAIILDYCLEQLNNTFLDFNDFYKNRAIPLNFSQKERKEYFNQLIINNDYNLLFKLIKEEIKEENVNQYKAYILLKSRFTKFKSLNISDTETRELLNKEQNKINQSLIEFIDIIYAS